MRAPVDLLHQFTPRPHLLVMTGTCCANSRGEAQLGDVCVVRPGSHESSLVADLEHMVEVWRLETGGSLVPERLRPVPRGVYQQMVCLARISTELQVCCVFDKDKDTPLFVHGCDYIHSVNNYKQVS